MNKIISHIFLMVVFTLCVKLSFAQGYPAIVTIEEVTERHLSATTIGVADKKKDAEVNAVESLFHTLFFIGVDGFNDGKPLVTNKKEQYISNFFANKLALYGSNLTIIKEAEKNKNKLFQTTLKVKIPIQNLMKELEQNGLYEPPVDKTKLEDVEAMANIVLPTVMVVPFKKTGENFGKILESDYDRRVAVSAVQAGFEERNIQTIDVVARIDAMKRRGEYEYGTAESSDKVLLMNSGADIYVTVDLKKDIQPSGSRVSVIMKAYETSSGVVLASQDGYTNRFRTSAIDLLCSYAVKDNLQPLLNKMTENLNKQVTTSKRVVLQISVGESSMTMLSDQVGANNYSLSNVIRSWVRSNSYQGKYHLQGIVEESMIFDYVMIPPKDADGLMMDAAQFGFLLQSYLVEEVGVQCSNKVDGNTIYITIQ